MDVEHEIGELKKRMDALESEMRSRPQAEPFDAVKEHEKILLEFQRKELGLS